MKILAIGDLVGEGAIKKLKICLPKIKDKYDICIVNAENTSQGMGLIKKDFEELMKLDIDVLTMGNHTWGKKDIFSFINNKRIIRPANYSKGVPGKGYTIIEKEGKKVGVINLIGRTDMNVLSENPFLIVDSILEKIKNNVDIIIVDFHAEATAEKIAMRYYLDGKISALFGTHTHVQTADEMILEKGTGYITDLGMTGPIKSIIGMDIDVSIKRFVTSLPEKYKLATGEYCLNGCLFEIDVESKKTTKITRINM